MLRLLRRPSVQFVQCAVQFVPVRSKVTIDDMLFTLPAQRELKEFGNRKVRLKLYGRNRSLGLLKIPEAASGQRGWLINNSQFSDAMTTLLFEFPSDTLPDFLARLSAPEDDAVLQGIGLSLDKATKELALHALEATANADAEAEAEGGEGQAVVTGEEATADGGSNTSTKPPPVGVLMSIEWTAATFSHRNEVGDLRQFIRPLGPSSLGGGGYTKQDRASKEKQEVVEKKQLAMDQYADKLRGRTPPKKK